MEIRLIEGQYESISARNWVRPERALPVLGNRDLTPIQGVFEEDTTRRSEQSAWDRRITGTLQ
jgi:hypothetical protein